ncbi:hypothetical protein DFH07DRAFT_957417 [Mycena maculata]|uniref:Uncharacterized protein n=1 Tax=Mycena maculata TaxID=230809 RepID=A0AAD7JAR6_9AGAR|nr:hypothetical protein DFH07DRAFT_957417 [Mycena maculata]
MSNIQEMAYKMSLKFEADQMTPWVRDHHNDSHGQVISSNSRYFTASRQIPDSARCPFDKRVDPAGVLAKLQTDTIVHCHDNDVAYLQLKDTRLVRKDPAGFRQGDIVEMGFAIVAYRTSKAGEGLKYTCKLALRTLTFLDATLTKASNFIIFALQGINRRKQEAFIARINSKQAQSSVSRTTVNSMSKRVRVYDDDESDDASFGKEAFRTNAR